MIFCDSKRHPETLIRDRLINRQFVDSRESRSRNRDVFWKMRESAVTVHHQTSFGIAFALTDCDLHTHARAPMNEFKNDVLLSYFKV